MKTSSLALAALLAVPAFATAQTYTNQIRQVQLPSGVDWRVPVTQSGEQLSPLAIDPGGARFELWTTKSGSPAVDYLLDEQYVGTYVPQAKVEIYTGDTAYTIIPRTRCDQPFLVKVTVSGLLSDPSAPDAAKAVDFLHHVQSYGATGTGVNLNRTQAILLASEEIDENSPANEPFNYFFALDQIPGVNRAKIRGEERFSVMSLEDYQVTPQVLSSKFLQIWPVADGSISGISSGQMIRFAMPNVTLTVNDVYPDSHTYAQVYKGTPALGTVGQIVPGSSRIIKDTVPQNLTLALSGYDSVFDQGGDGVWTMELLTSTPFGVDRLAYVSFSLDRTIEMNASVTTQE